MGLLPSSNSVSSYVLLWLIALISSSMAVCHFLSRITSSKLIFSASAKRHTRCTSFVEPYKSCKLRILGCRGSSSSSVVSKFILVNAMTNYSPTSIITSEELFQSHSLASFILTSRLTITFLLIGSTSLYPFVFSSYPIKIYLLLLSSSFVFH